MSTGVPVIGPVVEAPHISLSEVEGFDAQVKAALWNIDVRGRDTRCEDPVVGKLVFPSALDRMSTWLSEQEESIRRSERKLSPWAIYKLGRPSSRSVSGGAPGGPPYLVVVLVGLARARGATEVGCLLLGLPGGFGLPGSPDKPLVVPADADFEDVTGKARAAYADGGEAARTWHREVYEYRHWLRQAAAACMRERRR